MKTFACEGAAGSSSAARRTSRCRRARIGGGSGGSAGGPRRRSHRSLLELGVRLASTRGRRPSPEQASSSPQPGAARGRRADRGPAPRRRRGGLREDARAHAPRRVPHRRPKVAPNKILAITFTNKAAGEMRERLERMLGVDGARDLVLTFHAACGRILRREAEGWATRPASRSTTTRTSPPTKACLRSSATTRSALAARHPLADPETKNGLGAPSRRSSAPRRLGRDRRRGVRPLRAPPARLQRGRLRRHAHAHRRCARALPGRAGDVAERVPLHPRRRVPGHEPRPVPPAQLLPPSTGTSARSATRSVDLLASSRRHPQHHRVRGTTPGLTWSRSTRTTARRTRSCGRRTRSSIRTASASRRTSSDLGEGAPVRVYQVEDDTPRRGSWPPRSPA